MRWLTIVVMMLTVLTSIYMLFVIQDTKEDMCAEYCYPRDADLMDTATCTCWGDKIEVINLEDIK